VQLLVINNCNRNGSTPTKRNAPSLTWGVTWQPSPENCSTPNLNRQIADENGSGGLQSKPYVS